MRKQNVAELVRQLPDVDIINYRKHGAKSNQWHLDALMCTVCVGIYLRFAHSGDCFSRFVQPFPSDSSKFD